MNPAIEGIRFHIARGEYPQAAERWNQFASELQHRIQAGRLPASEWKEVTEFFSWSRNVLLCVRSQALDLLNTNFVAGTYGQAPQTTSPHIRASL